MKRAFGIDFSPLSQAEIVEALSAERETSPSGPQLVLTANVDHIVNLTKNRLFRSSYDQASIVTADGMPVYLYAKLKGVPLPARITGADLFMSLMPRLVPERHRCFFVNSSEATASAIGKFLQSRGFRADSIASVVPPFRFESDPVYSAALANRIQEHRTTHLFFGIGSPKSEIWCHQHRDRIGRCYVLCVGAGLDFFAGTKRRAPKWVQSIGFEWFWRFAHEPRRLFSRYFWDSWLFLGAILHDTSSSGRRRNA